MQFGAEPDQGKKPNVNRALWGWQYTSTGRVPGINGNADLDICYQDPAGTDETGTESGTIWCLFSPILFCARTEKKKADNPRSYQLFLYLSLFKDEQEQ